MDRSIDSIGSCSLDAESTDFSDTSESLNFISPSSTREDFTAGITERCRKIQNVQPLTPKLILNQPMNQRSTTTTTTAYFDINSGKISTIVSRADANGRYMNGTAEKYLSTKTIELTSPTIVSHANKKPSYLNLACCVNGYSNYTNYDSQERKDINKSREVSPIRPIINSISMSRQQRSNDNLLSVPAPVTFVKQSPLTSITKRFAGLSLDSKDVPDNAAGMMNGNGTVSNRKSFIQQRVEKLYGTTKILTSVKSSDSIQLNGNGTIQHLNGNGPTTNGTAVDEKENDEISMNSLPVMKHLRPEFCKQLQFMSSPKKTANRQSGNTNSTTTTTIKSPQNDITSNNIPKTTTEISTKLLNSELNNEVTVMEKIVNNMSTVENNQKVVNNNCDLSNKNITNNNSKMDQTETIDVAQSEIKDGNYFLRLLYTEKARILKIADETEKELEQLQSDPATIPTEEIIGLVLAAIGKSRLLATKKFKQFEGLCQENLKPSSDGPATLCGDLQGFWDMMMLQVENIDESYVEIQKCRENGWNKPQAPSPQPPKGSRLMKRPLTQSQTSRNKSNVPAKKPSSAPTNSEAAQRREEQRKKLLEMKRKQKAAIQNGTTDENVVISGDGDLPAMNGESKKENGDVEIFL